MENVTESYTYKGIHWKKDTQLHRQTDAANKEEKKIVLGCVWCADDVKDDVILRRDVEPKWNFNAMKIGSEMWTVENRLNSICCARIRIYSK